MAMLRPVLDGVWTYLGDGSAISCTVMQPPSDKLPDEIEPTSLLASLPD